LSETPVLSKGSGAVETWQNQPLRGMQAHEELTMSKKIFFDGHSKKRNPTPSAFPNQLSHFASERKIKRAESSALIGNPDSPLLLIILKYLKTNFPSLKGI
jgi:hypothetical protein